MEAEGGRQAEAEAVGGRGAWKADQALGMSPCPLTLTVTMERNCLYLA